MLLLIVTNHVPLSTEFIYEFIVDANQVLSHLLLNSVNCAKGSALRYQLLLLNVSVLTDRPTRGLAGVKLGPAFDLRMRSYRPV
jgi:hypothetical protein